MLAECITCGSLVQADDEQCRTNPMTLVRECECPFDENSSLCGGDDYTEDHRLDSPTHEPYSNLRR